MTILDLFSGIGGFSKAFENIKGSSHQHYFSEVDKYAIAVYQKQFPNAINLGDITKINIVTLPNIDYLFAGFPCTDLSISKSNRQGLEGTRSGLFWEAIKIWKHIKPKFYIFENVASMAEKDKDIISETLGVQPILINSALVSAQQRKRYYWTNIQNIKQPGDKHIQLKDILESEDTDRIKSLCITTTYPKRGSIYEYKKRQRKIIFEKTNQIGYIGSTNSQGNRIYSIEGKSVTLSAQGGGGGAKTGLYAIAPTKNNYIKEEYTIRKLSPIECCRLQTFPDNWNETGLFNKNGTVIELSISNTQRLKQLGNAVTVAVIEDILKTNH